MKASYRIGVKQVCRQHLRAFIAERFSDAKRSNARVLCFAGREALEVLEVYDTLGVARSNIVCLEQSRRFYNELVRRDQGIDVRLQKLDEFLDSPGQGRFDIVSLDFTGQLGTYENSIYRLASRGLLEDDAIVFTNFCGAREADATKGYYLAASRQRRDAPSAMELASVIQRHRGAPDKAARALEKEFGSRAGVNHDYLNESLADQRGEAIHEVVRSALTGGSAGMVEILFNELDEDGSLSSQAERYWTEIDNLPESDPAIAAALRRLRKASLKKDDVLPPVLLYQLSEDLAARLRACVKKFAEKSKRLRLNIPVVADILTLGIEECLRKRHCVQAAQSYKYISDRGTPMYADLYHLRRIQHFDYLNRLLPSNPCSLDELLEPVRCLSLDQFLRLIETLRRSGQRVAEMKSAEPVTPPRVALGRESVLNPRKPAVKLDRTAMKAEAVGLLLQSPDLTIEDIALRVGAKPMQVAAWKAHVTMGTYSPATKDHLRALADREYAAGRFPEALQLTARLRKQHPDCARLLNNYAVILGRMGREEEALRLLDRALGQHPQDPRLLISRAAQLHELDRLAEAEQAYQAAAAVLPEDSELMVSWGNVLCALSRHDEADVRYDAALALDGTCFEAKRGKAINSSERGRLDEALKQFDLLIDQQPQQSGTYYDRAVVLLKLGRTEASLVDLRKALTLRPDSFSALYNLGTTLLDLHEYEESRTVLLQAVRIAPANRSLLNNLAVACAGLQKHQEAADLFSQLMKLDPECSSALYGRSRALLSAGLLQESLVDCDRLVEWVPASSKYWTIRGRVLLALTRDAEAFDAFERASNLDSENAEAQIGKGLALSSQRKYTQALELFNNLRERFPQDTVILLERAEVLSSLELVAEALADFETILHREPANAAALGGKARALCCLGRLEESLPYFDESIRLEPSHYDTMFNKATVLTKLERLAEAVAVYDVCVQMHPDDHQAYSNRGTCKLNLGDLMGAEEDLTCAINLNHQDEVAWGNLAKISQICQRLVRNRGTRPKRRRGGGRSR